MKKDKNVTKKVVLNWVDGECASIDCPCGNNLIIHDYGYWGSNRECDKCGKQYYFDVVVYEVKSE